MDFIGARIVITLIALALLLGRAYLIAQSFEAKPTLGDTIWACKFSIGLGTIITLWLVWFIL